MRIKNRNKFVPGAYQMIHPEAGQKTPWKGSFSEIVQLELTFRTKNPQLVQKYGWSLDPQAVADDVDFYNAKRMAAGGWFNFIEVEEGVSAEKKSGAGAMDRGRSWFRNAANAAGNIKTALAVYRDLLGPDGKVVAKEEAERRAAVCVACPKNDTAGGLKKYFVKEAAREIMLLAGMLKDMDVTTSQDQKLGVCEVCECPMVAKVHVVNEVLKKHITQDQLAKFPPNCWIPGAVA